MRVKMSVECQHEIEVDVGRDDIRDAFEGSPPEETWFVVLNRFALALNALPDTEIATWTTVQRSVIRAFLVKHAARLEEQRHEC